MKASMAQQALTPEEFAEYQRLQIKVMRFVGSSGAGGRAHTPAQIEAAQRNGRKGGRPRKLDSELKRPRRKPKEEK